MVSRVRVSSLEQHRKLTWCSRGAHEKVGSFLSNSPTPLSPMGRSGWAERLWPTLPMLEWRLRTCLIKKRNNFDEKTQNNSQMIQASLSYFAAVSPKSSHIRLERYESHPHPQLLLKLFLTSSERHLSKAGRVKRSSRPRNGMRGHENFSPLPPQKKGIAFRGLNRSLQCRLTITFAF